MLVEEQGERRECGTLTDRAHDELQATLEGLDPREDHAHDPEVPACDPGPGAWVHIEGFDHSPSACDWRCCAPELARAGLVYALVEYHFLGEVLSFDGEPYVAVEPDKPCP
ncbi:hypothetical protein [Paraliomyxa miuraensis]|uniref:hypothetical protein n=1 Tax=Paraliomyxa miuraensis TaxID=376150 RepID=UPI0022502A5A|nr:hypothetical protein [Paraliomyxa miuraensis]MCX4242525.1 hypothetical protein [Paraliomyxa miuraensis]